MATFYDFSRGLSNRIFNGMLDFNETIKKSTGIDVGEKMLEMQENDERLRKEKPVQWTLKKVAKGTIFGLFGAGWNDLNN